MGFISASRVLKIGDASQLYYTCVAVTNVTFFIFHDCYLREKENIPSMRMKRLSVPSSGCEVLGWPPGGIQVPEWGQVR